jgi:hypothetical protein
MKRLLTAVLVMGVIITASEGWARVHARFYPAKPAVPKAASPIVRGEVNAWSGIFGRDEGGEVPFPFGNEARFPWSTIEGTYFAQSDDYEAYFSFEVVDDAVGEPHLKVLHYENDTGREFGEGGGFAQSDARVVRAAMRARNGLSYLIFVRSFNNVYIEGQSVSHATVLTIRSFRGELNQKDWHFLLKKISNRPLLFSK